MSETSVTAVVYGLGAMGSVITRFATEKGVELVGAIDTVNHIGEDLGTACGIAPLGVKVSDDPNSALAKRPDLVVLTTRTLLVDVVDQIRVCIAHGCNVLTSSEETAFPWRTAPGLAREIDGLAKQAGVTVVGSGFEDFFWENQIAQLAGTCHRIERLEGYSRFNLDEYGAEVLSDNRVGSSLEESAAHFSSGQADPGYFQWPADYLTSELGLTLASLEETVQPVVAETVIPSKALGRDIEAGLVRGTANVVKVVTEEGVDMRLEIQGIVYAPGEQDVNRWRIIGEPCAAVENVGPVTELATCATLVHRIPDVIAARPGLLTIRDLPRLTYRSRV